MTIDTDVAATAKHWGLDPHLLQAVVNAEGNIVRAVAISIPSVTTRQEALEVTCRSAVHAMCDFIKANDPNVDLPDYSTNLERDFVAFFAARWAPVGVANDPHGLNRAWPSNVLSGWLRP